MGFFKRRRPCKGAHAYFRDDLIPLALTGKMVLSEAEVGLDLFERFLFGFGVDEEDDEELQGHHGGEEDEGESVALCGDDGEDACDDGVHDPV